MQMQSHIRTIGDARPRQSFSPSGSSRSSSGPRPEGRRIGSKPAAREPSFSYSEGIPAAPLTSGVSAPDGYSLWWQA